MIPALEVGLMLATAYHLAKSARALGARGGAIFAAAFAASTIAGVAGTVR